MSIEILLDKLQGVLKTPNGWRARCPSCGGRSRKLSIAMSESGAILLACFDCHDTPAILEALGLEVKDLFPERIAPTTAAERRALRERAAMVRWGSALDVLHREAGVLLIAVRGANWLKFMSDNDRARIEEAARKIEQAKEILRPSRK